MKNNKFDKSQKAIFAVGLGIVAGMTFLIGFFLAQGFTLTSVPMSFLLVGAVVSLLPLFLTGSGKCGGSCRK